MNSLPEQVVEYVLRTRRYRAVPPAPRLLMRQTDALRRYPFEPRSGCRYVGVSNERRIDRERRKVEQPRTVTPEDVLGPLNDFELKAAPRKLFLRGDESLLKGGPRIAVVGSRRASSQGLELARRITEELVSHHIIVVSGLALGIDTVTHETAMSCGGRTVGVLGTSLDRYAVPRNRNLQDADWEAASAGVAVSARSTYAPVELPSAKQDDGPSVGRHADRGGDRQQRDEAPRLGGDQAWAARPLSQAVVATAVAGLGRGYAPLRGLWIRCKYASASP